MSNAEVQLSFTDATEAGCRVFAQWTGVDAGEPETWLYGPESRYASTLRARYPLRRRPGAAGGPLEAWIDEPCFWTPAGPYVYQVEVLATPTADARKPRVETRPIGLFGIRRLQARRDFLEFDQKRWVLRGAVADAAISVEDWHAAPLAALVDSPSDKLCERASRLGVLLLARVPAEVDAGLELRRLARWPAVGVAILEQRDDKADLAAEAPNLILAQWFSADAAPKPAEWARLVFCDVDQPADFARRVAGFPQPIVAVRRDKTWSSPAEARAGCDRLQSELAAVGVQMAGYIV